jgi:hypothetical protein
MMGWQVDHAGSIAGMAVALIGDYAERIEGSPSPCPPTTNAAIAWHG